MVFEAFQSIQAVEQKVKQAKHNAETEIRENRKILEEEALEKQRERQMSISNYIKEERKKEEDCLQKQREHLEKERKEMEQYLLTKYKQNKDKAIGFVWERMIHAYGSDENGESYSDRF